MAGSHSVPALGAAQWTHLLILLSFSPHLFCRHCHSHPGAQAGHLGSAAAAPCLTLGSLSPSALAGLPWTSASASLYTSPLCPPALPGCWGQNPEAGQAEHTLHHLPCAPAPALPRVCGGMRTAAPPQHCQAQICDQGWGCSSAAECSAHPAQRKSWVQACSSTKVNCSGIHFYNPSTPGG